MGIMSLIKGNKENGGKKNRWLSRQRRRREKESLVIPAKEAYKLSLPAIRKKVWENIRIAAECGRNISYWIEDDTKLPTKVVKELVMAGYKVTVTLYSFKRYPSVDIIFGRNDEGGLFTKVDNDLDNTKHLVPLTYEEYDKMDNIPPVLEEKE